MPLPRRREARLLAVILLCIPWATHLWQLGHVCVLLVQAAAEVESLTSREKEVAKELEQTQV